METNNGIQKNCPEQLSKDIENKKELSIRWLRFFTYIRIPLGIVVMLIQILASRNLLL